MLTLSGRCAQSVTRTMLNPGVIGGRQTLSNIGKVIKQRRAMNGLTLHQLGDKSGVSSSHLGRIERGDRFPSAHILRKIAQPLGFQEGTLLIYAGYLSAPSVSEGTSPPLDILGGLDPYVARVLSQEPVEVQRTLVAILSVLNFVPKGVAEREK